MPTKSGFSLCALVLAVAILPAAAGDAVRLKGVPTMRDLAKRLTDWYARKNPAMQFDVSAAQAADGFAALAALGQDPNGLAFGSVDSRGDPKVRFLAIKASASAEAIGPTSEAIRAKKYMLVRPLFFYFAGPPQGELLRFAEWILSAEGQLVVESAGFYPLTSAEREAGLQALIAKP